jgi:AraC-like DNA-binding protein
VSAGDTYRELRPHVDLADLVACTWWRTIEPGGRTRPVLPDGCVDIVHRMGGGLFVAGPDTRPVEVGAADGATFVGMRFHTGCAAGVLGVPADALLDDRVDLEDIWGRPAATLAARLSESRDAVTALAVLNAAVAARRPHMGHPDMLVLEAVQRAMRPNSRVAALATDLHVSERQLRRRFTAAVGYGPKTLQRIARLRRFLAAANAGRGDTALAALARSAGYADQAHMTRECARLTGRTPAAMLARR